MSQLTRDYKGSGRRPAPMSGMKEFGLGVLAGALFAGGGAALIAAHAHHGHAHSAVACAAPGTKPTRSSGAAAARSAPGASSATLAQSSATAATGTPASSAQTQTPAPAPQYDFYQMLQKFTVPVPANGASVPARRPAPAAGAGARFIVQIGSYSSDAQARQVRERLAHLGVTAQIERFTEHGRVLNRVRIGPVDGRQLRSIRARLAAADFHPLVMPAGGG